MEISVAYRKQVFFDDEIRIRVGIKQYNGISLEFNYEFLMRAEMKSAQPLIPDIVF